MALFNITVNVKLKNIEDRLDRLIEIGERIECLLSQPPNPEKPPIVGITAKPGIPVPRPPESESEK